MTSLFLDNMYLILLIPFWIFLIIMLGRFFSVYVNKNILYTLTLLASLIGIIFSGAAFISLEGGKILETQIPFVKINNFILSAGIHVDQTSLIFALILFIVSFIVQLFSISYMKNEKKNYRFYALLNLFNFAMAGLFFSPNLFQAYVFWELVGVTSYFLIGFEYFKQEKSIASKKVFIINRIGDTALIGAIILCSYLMYSYSGNSTLTTLGFIDINIISTLVSAYSSTSLYWGICILFIIAAAVKSAQFPFFTWLQDAMEAKLPVSALLHSATMVASGVFLIIRLYPFFTLETGLMEFIAGLGLLTAIICSLCACSENHPKRVLAYSTSAQLGLMFFALGIGNLKGAFIFFAAHAFIKSGLFLCLNGQPANILSQETKSSCAFSYPNFILFLLGGLSLSGILFSGMIAKEFLYSDLSQHLKIIYCLISFLTAFYIVRIALITGVDTKNKKLEFCPILLTILNIVLYFYIRFHVKYEISAPFWIAILSCICVYILYIKNAFWKIPLLYQIAHNGFYLDKFYTKTVTAIYNKTAQTADFIDTKILSNYSPLIKIAKFGVKTSEFIEEHIMNGTVQSASNFVKFLSKLDIKAQNGSIQRYNAYAFIIITTILTCLIIGSVSLYRHYMGG